MTAEEAVAQVDEIEQLAESASPNADAFDQVKAIAFSLAHTIDPAWPPASVHEKTEEIVGWAEILFSVRKHEKSGGADKVLLNIRHACASLRQIIQRSA